MTFEPVDAFDSLSHDVLFAEFVRRKEACHRRDGDEATIFHAFLSLSRYIQHKPAAHVIERIEQRYAPRSAQH